MRKRGHSAQQRLLQQQARVIAMVRAGHRIGLEFVHIAQIGMGHADEGIHPKQGTHQVEVEQIGRMPQAHVGQLVAQQRFLIGSGQAWCSSI